MKPSGVLQVQYSFPQAAAGLQQVTLALQTGSGEQVFAEVQLHITAGADAVSAAHSSAEGPGLSGAVAGHPGEVIVIMQTVLTPPYMTVSICPHHVSARAAEISLMCHIKDAFSIGHAIEAFTLNSSNLLCLAFCSIPHSSNYASLLIS